MFGWRVPIRIMATARPRMRRASSSVPAAVWVPLIVTGPAHFAKTNEVLKQVVTLAGENLLSWAEI